MLEIAVVGGGPAGSYCAYYLAGNDHYPVIFDHTHPREKPCGGLVTPFTQRLFPFLTRLSIKHGERKKLCLISPSGRHVCLLSRKGKFRSFSRLKLDQFLVNMAVDKGAKLIEEKVVALERKKDFWKVKTTCRFYNAKILIGADGVNSLVRRSIIGPLRKADKGVCCGYLVRGLEKEDITLSFSARRKGYMWVIPRYDQTSLGIWTFEESRSHGLRRELDIFIKHQYPNVKIVSKWASLIPNVKNFKTFQIPVAGSNWILIGDAAGHVSPIMGEGIVYALLDGELAAKAIIENEPEMFNKLWKEAYGTSLFIDVTLRKRLYTRLGLELFCEFLKLYDAFIP